MTAAIWSGVVPMTPDRYDAFARLAGPWLEEHRCCQFAIGEDSGREERAVYIAVNSDCMACYCGRTRPTRILAGGASVVRIHQHITTTRSKYEEWAGYWMLPLVQEAPDEFVDWLERTVTARLGLPRRHNRSRW